MGCPLRHAGGAAVHGPGAQGAGQGQGELQLHGGVQQGARRQRFGALGGGGDMRRRRSGRFHRQTGRRSRLLPLLRHEVRRDVEGVQRYQGGKRQGRPDQGVQGVHSDDSKKGR